MNATAEALRKKLDDAEVNPEIVVLAICDRQLRGLGTDAATRVLGYLAAAHAYEGEMEELMELGRRFQSMFRHGHSDYLNLFAQLAELTKAYAELPTVAAASQSQPTAAAASAAPAGLTAARRAG